MRATPLIAAAVLLLAGCSSSASKPAAAPAVQPPTTSGGATAITSQVPATTSAAHSTTPPASTATTAAAKDLTGFGATQGAWDAHHTADSGKTAAGFYNPDPALPKTTDGQINDDYSAVTADNGRVDAYFRAFTARPTAAALQLVKAELPADAVLSKPVVTTGATGSKCLILTATSQAVGKVLGGANGSRVLVELQSWNPAVLDQNSIMSAALVTANKGDAPGC